MFRAFFLGLSVGLLFAPKTGRQMRQSISHLFTEFKEHGPERLADLEAKGCECVENVSRTLIEVGEKGSGLLENAVTQVEEVRRRGGEAMEKVNEKLSQVRELGAQRIQQASELKDRVLEAGRQNWDKAREAAEAAVAAKSNHDELAEPKMKSQGSTQQTDDAEDSKQANHAKKNHKQKAATNKDHFETKIEVAAGQEARAQEMRKQEDFMDDGSRGTLERGTGEHDVEKAEQAKKELGVENEGQEDIVQASDGELDQRKAEELAAKLNAHHVSTPANREVA